jgi:hypothetical protein
MTQNTKNITIRLDRGPAGIKLLFKFSGISALVKSQPFSERELVETKKRFSELLKELRSFWWKGGLENRSFSELSESIKQIHVFTLNFLHDIFDGEEIRCLSEQLGKATVEGISDLIYLESPLGIIEYEGNLDEFIPLDYLFIPHRRIAVNPKNLPEFILALSQVLGFSYIIQRNPPKKGSRDFEDLLISKLGKRVHFECKLKTDLYVYNGLPYVGRERDFFTKDNFDYFDAEIEIPEIYGGDPAEKLMDNLLAKENVQFHHFCCHCDSTDDDTWKHSLKFGRNRLFLKDLRYHYLTNKKQIRFDETIAFLNTCGGAVVNPLTKASFPSVFLDCFGHAGFIGPEYKIPDAFACEFARVFYANLLRFGNLGLALFKTRWFFAKKYNNPLGLFYTLYADNEIKLSRTVDTVNIYSRSE